MRFQALDSWRGIAALMVALLHFGMNTHMFDLPIIYNASLFVDFFFVLSGFVLSHAYGQALNGGMTFTGYLIRRVGRLWPLHMAIILILMFYEFYDAWKMQNGLLSVRPLFTAEDGRDFALLMQNVFLVQATGITGRLGWNPPAWSISAELWICLLFAATWIVLPRKALTLAAASIALASCTILAVFSPTYMATALKFALLKCAAGFFIGVLVHRLRDRVPKLSGTTWEIVTVLVMIGFLSLVTVEEADPWTMLAPPIFGLVVLVFSYEGGVVSRALKVRPLILLGTLSYSIYMVHNTVSWQLGAWVRACIVDKGIPGCSNFAMIDQRFLESRGFADLVAIVYLLIVIGVSAMTYLIVEKPGRSAFNRGARWVEQRRPTQQELPA